MSVLVTGGAGYIGSHTVLALLKAGLEVVVVDNLSNASEESIKRVEELTNKTVAFYQADILDMDLMSFVFSRHEIESVIHFAGLKAVGESSHKPLEYYHNNVTGTMALVAAMKDFGVSNLVFSSSATVYGEQNKPPYIETQTLGLPSSPYGKTKSMVEEILKDYCIANEKFKVANLRYFNPIGADVSGKIGEDPNGIPNNLMPFVAQVAVGKRDKLSIFGNDYNTKDGTCLRDYIHVTDLAQGHIDALNWLVNQESGLCEAFNLGTGQPLSVLDIVHGFEQYTKQKVSYEFSSRREGDLPAFWADASKAEEVLSWKPVKTLRNMMEDTWRWQSGNPKGYES
ncbi:UDP-glucose 4-epimerase GalE [Thalassotalea euphylliae]|uniref:UDP-glucose 4-epimerase n=1 Tax=Thalassotalea euphylliae TaxID=1655234 RepID=A0A3E0TV05_9GAMM|nr:UDP-glucose 4-epimerase GalE [Thalassotalea euphylliae]REL28284.1 UDP-glucose 4-epimerase GalE [Thalassotalea euphylliae]